MSIKATKWAYSLFETTKIPAKDRIVLLALCWDHTEAGGCYPSQERISVLSGHRVRAVYDCLNRLEAYGVITRKTTRKGGKFQKTTYQLFGRYSATPSADGGRRDHRLKNADGDHRRTGAEYRGIYLIEDNTKKEDLSKKTKLVGGSDD